MDSKIRHAMSKLRTEVQKPSEDVPRPSGDHKITYDVVCRDRYKRSVEKYEEQFKNELLLIERSQNRALEGVRVHRALAQSVLDHKIPKRGNMKDLCTLNLNSKDDKRLKQLLNEI